MNKTVAELASRLFARNIATLSDVEKRILQSAVDRKPVAVDTNVAFAKTEDYGDRIADSIARIGG